MSEPPPPEGTPGQDAAGQDSSKAPLATDGARSDAINALVNSLEQLVISSEPSTRPALLFSNEGEHKTLIQRFQACLRRAVWVSRARVVALLICLIVLVAASLFVPPDLFANLLKRSSDEFSLQSPNSNKESRPSYVSCCPSGSLPNSRDSCCTLSGDKEELKAILHKREETELEYAKLDLLIAQQAYEKNQNDDKTSPGTRKNPSPVSGKRIADAFFNIPMGFWIVCLTLTCVIGFFAFASTVAEGGCLSILGGCATRSTLDLRKKQSIVSPSLMRAVIKSGTLFALIEDLIERDYPRSGTNRHHLRAIANDLYDACEGQLSLLLAPQESTISSAEESKDDIAARPFREGKLDWLRDVASRRFLNELANDPAFKYLLEDQAERRRPWLRLVPIIAHQFAQQRPAKDGESDLKKDGGKIVALILALILLPLLGSYVGASTSNRSLEEQTKILLIRLAQIGPNGAPGSAGSPGVAGAPGPQGAPGAAGVAGPPGVQGSPGERGVVGPSGAQGVPGASGGTGPPGVQGSPGERGVVGPSGVQGSSGSPGATGLSGQSGSPTAAGVAGGGNPCGQGDHCCNPSPCGADTAKPGGEVLARFSRTQGYDSAEVVYQDQAKATRSFELVLDNPGGWPPDPVRLKAYDCTPNTDGKALSLACNTPPGKNPTDSIGDVSVAKKRAFSAVLNADVWVEESAGKHWYEFGLGKDLLVVHILPRSVKTN
jgi:hypothetical protein